MLPIIHNTDIRERARHTGHVRELLAPLVGEMVPDKCALASSSQTLCSSNPSTMCKWLGRLKELLFRWVIPCFKLKPRNCIKYSFM